LDVTIVPAAQTAFEVIVTEMKSLLVSVLSVYELAVPATVTPFFLHWYAGDVPPLTGVAVNVTGACSHTAAEGALSATAGTTVGRTVSVRLEAGDVAQVALAVTLIVPPAEPANAWMDGPVVVPLQPEGRVQV
jgi:hypothetical protein